MKKWLSLTLLIGVIALGWLLFSIPGILAFFAALPQAVQLVMATVAVVTLGIWGFTIDPYIGECIWRIGIYIVLSKFDKDAKLEFPERSGSGSGRSGRTN